MNSFIKLDIIHPNNLELDTVFYIRADEIVEVRPATTHDKKSRSEINAFVRCRTSGESYAAGQKAVEILDQIKDGSLNH